MSRATPGSGYSDMQRRIVVSVKQGGGYSVDAPGGALSDEHGLATGPFRWNLSFGDAAVYSANGIDSPYGSLDIVFTQSGDGNVYGLTITARDFVAGANRVVWTFAAPCGP